QMGLPFAGFVLNRSWARTDGFVDPSSLELDSSPAAISGIEKLKVLAKLEMQRVTRDRALLERLQKELPGSSIAVAAPYLGEAIEDLKGLGLLAHGIAEARA